MREDGNNVNIDSEMTNQAANSLMYNALITQINNRLSNTRTVINGGR
jgi:flagellar basal-body rod protein FlgB